MTKTASGPGPGPGAGPKAAARAAAKTVASLSRGLEGRVEAGGSGASDAPPPSNTDASEVFAALIRPYLAKLAAEREARLAGRTVDADFALRQATVYEIALDLAARSDGRIGVEALRAVCGSGELGLADIAESQLSKLLGDARRALWAELAAAGRPEATGAGLLCHSAGADLSTEPAETLAGGKDLLAQKVAMQVRHEEAARAQVEWEECPVAAELSSVPDLSDRPQL